MENDQQQPTENKEPAVAPEEPQKPADTPETPPLQQNAAPEPKKSHKLALVIFLLVLSLIVAGAAAYLMSQEEDEPAVETPQATVETPEETVETPEKTEIVYQSELYPDLSFTVPEGWEVSEPETYTDNGNGEGSADSIIVVSADDVMLNLEFVTVKATGFEGYRCYNYETLTAVGGVYRYVDSEGAVVYAEGVSEADDEWAEVIAEEGEFTFFEDPDPNYCVSFPFIGTYSSTLNQADYPEYPYGFTDQEKAIVWMSASIEGSPTESQQADADAIIKSLSSPDLGI